MAIVLVRGDIYGLDSQLSAVRHCIPSVDGEIDDSRLKMIGVDFDLPQPCTGDRLDLDALTECALEEILQGIQKIVQIERFWIQRLPAGEGQQAACKGCRTLSPALGVTQRTLKVCISG